MDETPKAGERAAASSRSGYTLLVVTLVAVALSVGLLSIMRRAVIVAALVGWKWLSASERRDGGLGYFVLHVLPQLIVVGPPLSAAVALACGIHFVSRGGTLSRRARLIWLLALCGATAGWPVACSCVSLQGLAESGEPLSK